VVEKTLAPYFSLAFDDVAAGHYARIRYELVSEGRNIGPYDLQIAAICLANDCMLVTANVDEFENGHPVLMAPPGAPVMAHDLVKALLADFP